MQINSTRKQANIGMPKVSQSSKGGDSASTLGVVDTIADGYHSLPRWPQAAVRGIASYAPASIGASIGSQYGGFAGRLVGAAVGAAGSYMFLTEVADAFPRQAKVNAALSGVIAAVQGGGGLSLSGVGITLGWGAGLGMVQEFAMGR
jgi:hypothetical protein